MVVGYCSLSWSSKFSRKNSRRRFRDRHRHLHDDLSEEEELEGVPLLESSVRASVRRRRQQQKKVPYVLILSIDDWNKSIGAHNEILDATLEAGIKYDNCDDNGMLPSEVAGKASPLSRPVDITDIIDEYRARGSSIKRRCTTPSPSSPDPDPTSQEPLIDLDELRRGDSFHGDNRSSDNSLLFDL